MRQITGADPGFDQGGGPQIVTGLKLPFWGLSFVEFWCWGLIFGGQGGSPGPGAPHPGSAPGLFKPGLSEMKDITDTVNDVCIVM